ncbi:hypothetical protein [Azospirillum sp. TSO22-1]|uniref:hypothetical protein n=1 Tax=Azospirillum sp. TSO22-1 TaxID=716789 RepID=UPI000D60EDD5|nr:hypothetical protein [Azospirillum sp. TSO22-1]PWC31749.1 hypothetical protein TSO221_32990 [Azospirillum sp. TSO22-1]
MPAKPVWTKISPRHFRVQNGSRRVDITYEGAGFQSAWSVYAGGKLVTRHPGFLDARGLALKLATENT